MKWSSNWLTEIYSIFLGRFDCAKATDSSAHHATFLTFTPYTICFFVLCFSIRTGSWLYPSRESSACIWAITTFLASSASATACYLIQAVSEDLCDISIASRDHEYAGDLFHWKIYSIRALYVSLSGLLPKIQSRDRDLSKKSGFNIWSTGDLCFKDQSKVKKGMKKPFEIPWGGLKLAAWGTHCLTVDWKFGMMQCGGTEASVHFHTGSMRSTFEDLCGWHCNTGWKFHTRPLHQSSLLSNIVGTAVSRINVTFALFSFVLFKVKHRNRL